MGEWTTFSCDACGYESASIRWGAGMLDPRERYMPGECLQCKDYVEVNLTGADLVVDEFACPKCASDVFFVERSESYQCPQCGTPNVRLKPGEGYW